MQRHLLGSVIAGFLFGVFMQSVTKSTMMIVVFISLGFGVALVAGSFLVYKKISVFFLVGLSFLAFGSGFYRSYHVNQKHGDALMDQFVEKNIVFLGQIIEDPDERQYNTKLIIHAEKLLLDSETRTIDTKILVTIDSYYIFTYGDKVKISGTLRQPENFITDTGREFNYQNYLEKDDIFYRMSFVDIEKVSSGGSLVKKSMLEVKNILVERIDQFFPQPEGALLAGVLFGEQAGLGQDLQDNFRKTGIVHIVVLSGFNVTIVAIFIVWVLRRFLSEHIALLFGIVGIILFAILVGAGATIIRASVMAILAIIARVLGREHDVIRVLFLAAFFMVLQNPKILLFDISFQLSFLATLSLIYFAPVIENYFGWITEKFTLRETVVSTFAAQIFVLPLLLYSIGEFSIVSPIVNVLVVPWVSITMLLGFISALLGLIWSGFGMILMVPTYIILHLQILVVKFFGDLPFAAVTVPEFPVWLLGCIYGLLSLWIARLHIKNLRQENAGK